MVILKYIYVSFVNRTIFDKKIYPLSQQKPLNEKLLLKAENVFKMFPILSRDERFQS